jgi:hypothetical protein
MRRADQLQGARLEQGKPMADDEVRQRPMRGLLNAISRANGVAQDITPFVIVIAGQIEAIAKSELLEMRITIDPRVDYKIERIVPQNGEPQVQSMKIPLSLLAGVQPFKAWTAIEDEFSDLLRDALTLETLSHFQDVINYVLLEIDPSLGNKRLLIAGHTTALTERLKVVFNIPLRGNPSEWSPLELTKAISGIMRGMDQRLRTYTKVAERMRAIYGDKAPPSGDALRKLVERFKLDWMKLKSGQ